VVGAVVWHMDSQRPVRSLIYGGCAGAIAEVATIPFDVLKVRMQLQGEQGRSRQYSGAWDAVVKVARNEGPLAFTAGAMPACVRQLTYGSLRFGLYSECKRLFGVNNSTDSALFRKVSAAGTAGGLAAFVCSPTDLIKVRMQSAGVRPGASSQRYRGMSHAFSSIVRLEGARGLYKGVVPTSARAAAVCAAEIASYDEVKCALLRSRYLPEGVALHLVSGILSGFFAVLASSPFDVVKSRIMSQPFDSRGVGVHYTGMTDCFRKSWQSEGLRFAFKGFWPNYACKGPSVVLLFMLYEQIQRVGDQFLDHHFDQLREQQVPIVNIA